MWRWGPVHTNAFSFENASFSMHFLLLSTLRWWRFSKMHAFSNENALCGQRKRRFLKMLWFDLHNYYLHNAPSIKNLFLPFSLDGRKRYENASVDVKLLLHFQWNENGGFWKHINLVWTWPKSLLCNITPLAWNIWIACLESDKASDELIWVCTQNEAGFCGAS